jgi:hypothetical protein
VAHTYVRIGFSHPEFIDCAGADALADVLADSGYGSWRVEVAPNTSGQAARLFDPVTAPGWSSES